MRQSIGVRIPFLSPGARTAFLAPILCGCAVTTATQRAIERAEQAAKRVESVLAFVEELILPAVLVVLLLLIVLLRKKIKARWSAWRARRKGHAR